MSRCRIVGEKPIIFKDDDGWICAQVTTCLRCNAVDSTRLAEDATFQEAVDSLAMAWPDRLDGVCTCEAQVVESGTRGVLVGPDTVDPNCVQHGRGGIYEEQR